MNSLTTYINTNILLMSALSCMTLTDTELLSLSSRQTYNDAIIPSINTPVNPINIYTNYSIKDIPISTETIHVNIPEHEDFEIINSFANKMLTEATSIDEEIQNVINDHFWDMLLLQKMNLKNIYPNICQKKITRPFWQNSNLSLIT